MRITIKETGEVKTLRLTDHVTKIDWTDDFIANNGAFANGDFETVDGNIVAKSDAFQWWEERVEAENELSSIVAEIVANGHDYNIVIQTVADARDGLDLEDQVSVAITSLEEEFNFEI